MSKARFSQRRGVATQKVAAMRLTFYGFRMVQQIATPTAMIGGKRRFSGKAEGDIRAIGPGGLSVLCEAKWRPERLVFSDLEDHQWQNLDQHHALGGISLLAWQCRAGLFIVPWDILRAQGFAAGEGIGVDWAEKNQWKNGQTRQ